jgi:hypothetical protein
MAAAEGPEQVVDPEFLDKDKAENETPAFLSLACFLYGRQFSFVKSTKG